MHSIDVAQYRALPPSQRRGHIRIPSRAVLELLDCNRRGLHHRPLLEHLALDRVHEVGKGLREAASLRGEGELHLRLLLNHLPQIVHRSRV
jgi:hypothetical protein